MDSENQSQTKKSVKQRNIQYKEEEKLNENEHDNKHKKICINDCKLENENEKKILKRTPIRYCQKPIWAHKWPGSRAQMIYTRGVPDPFRVLGSLIETDSAISGSIPYEDLNRYVVTWLFRKFNTYKNIAKFLEVEVKIGTIFSKETNCRLNLPVLSEVLINKKDLSNIEFVSNMDENDHYALKEYLNERCISLPGEVFHKEQVLEDSFYKVEKASVDRLRVTKDLNNNEIISKVLKQRIDDLLIFCPENKYDIRVTLSKELLPSEKDLQNTSTDSFLKRKKLRNSYFYGVNTFDHTIVDKDGTTDSRSYEMEIELDTKTIIDTLESMNDKNSNAGDRLQGMVHSLIDNARVMVRIPKQNQTTKGYQSSSTKLDKIAENKKLLEETIQDALKKH